MPNLKNVTFAGMATIFLFAAGVASHSARAAQEYSIQNLGDFVPLGINDSSQIAGVLENGIASAVTWTAGVTTLIPSTLPQSSGASINNAGEIVGGTLDAQSNEEGFIWNSTTGFVSPISPPEQSFFGTVNNLGQIGGFYANPTESGMTAAIWNPDGTVTSLPALPGADNNTVVDLNDLGQAVGTSSPSSTGLPHAVLWQNGNAIDLTPNSPDSTANAINNEGQIVGTYDIPENGTAPYIWDTTHGLTNLPNVSASTLTDPADINDQGQIVGDITVIVPGGSYVGFASLWENGMLYDLNDLIPVHSGWDLQYTFAINNSGQIVGTGTYNDQQEGFLLTPIPEPAAFILATGFYLLTSPRRSRGSKHCNRKI
ncbi:MAG TPA: hypothetical protein VG722_12160 [Tepidisphaeraceae bacterium]|nr:hypothetical protein [Tepidisphaeraceae bacterium]